MFVIPPTSVGKEPEGRMFCLAFDPLRLPSSMFLFFGADHTIVNTS
jgi:hypothetical protein